MEIKHECKLCGKEFYGYKRKNRKYCSRSCRSKSQIGKTVSPETIRKTIESRLVSGNMHSTPTYIDNDGFVVITGSSKRLHTAIAETVLGRPLKPNEVVHHIDEDRQNNNNNNLVICERSLHPTIHARMRRMKERL